MTEFSTTALLLVTFGVLLLTSAVFSRGLERAGVPVALLFLALGMLAGDEGLGSIRFEDYRFTFRMGTIALILILFDGGLNTTYGAIRQALSPALALATFGVALTAALVAIGGRLFGLPWSEAILLGAIVSSTDAATVFAVLRGSQLNLVPRVAATLEIESGLNDATAVILTIAVTEAFISPDPVGLGLLWQIPLQLAVGGLVGVLTGLSGRTLLRRVRISAGGLYPVVTLGLALLAFGVSTLCHGSGFLAVYVAAIVIGNGSIPYRSSLNRIHDALAWICQIAMFLMLGLLVFPSRLGAVAGIGLFTGLFLAVVARPVAVAVCLLPFRFSPRKIGYIGWVGLRGAVPIILATYPVISGFPGAERVFNIVFFVVVVNAIVPGATIRMLTRRLGLERLGTLAPHAVLEVASTRLLKGELISFYIDSNLLVCGTTIAEIPLPAGSAVALVVRSDELVAPGEGTTLMEGDHVHVVCRSADRAFISLLFGRPEEA